MNRTELLIIVAVLLIPAQQALAQEDSSVWAGEYAVNFIVERSEGCSQTMVINGYTGNYALNVTEEGSATLILHIDHDHLSEPEEAPEEALEYEEVWAYSWVGSATVGEDGLSLSLPEEQAECSRLQNAETRTVTCWDASPPVEMTCERQLDDERRPVCHGGDLPLLFSDATFDYPYLMLSTEPLHYERRFWNDPIITAAPESQ